MAGVRHLVNICRGRRKSLFLLLATIGVMFFLFGRMYQGGGLFDFLPGGNNVQQRDLSVQNVGAGGPVHPAPGVDGGRAPVFPDPVRQGGVQEQVVEEKKPDLPRDLPKPTTKDVGYVSALNKTWMTWKNVDSPGTYRACVPKPPDDEMAEVVTGGLISDTLDMTITTCLETCTEMGFTYAALRKGTQCYCSDVKGNSTTLLTYLDSTNCNSPCGGDKQYHCGGEKHFSLYRTRVPDARCSHMELKPEGTLPLIALASFPRTGNTWTRQLIERATGMYTGSFYWKHESKQVFGSKGEIFLNGSCQPGLSTLLFQFYLKGKPRSCPPPPLGIHQAFPGGNVDYTLKQTVCVKSHESATDHVKLYDDGAVILIRNPYAAIVAEVFRRFLFEKETPVEDAMKYFNTEEWVAFAKAQSERWKNMATQWIDHSSRVLAIHYEDMQARQVETLSKIVNFLHVEPDRTRILCATQEYPSSHTTGISLGNHGSKTRVYLTYDPFSPELRQIIDGYINTVNETLAAHHQKVLPSDYHTIKVF